jgi:hypothetical protein
MRLFQVTKLIQKVKKKPALVLLKGVKIEHRVTY